VDDRGEYTPGWKFNQWELKGVPLRIEIGPRDLKQEQAVMVRRDNKQKSFVKEADVMTTAQKLLDDIQHDLFARAKAKQLELTTTVKTYDEFKQVVGGKGGFVKAAWCGSPECEAKIKEETGATVRVIPFEKEQPTTDCVYCGKKAKDIAYFARSY
jgi:prolyl-tRNA synthetase